MEKQFSNKITEREMGESKADAQVMEFIKQFENDVNQLKQLIEIENS